MKTTKIETKADVKRIPPGTRLRAVRNLRGEIPPAEGGRIFNRAVGSRIVFIVDAPGTKYHGAETDIHLDKHHSIETRPGGFAVLGSTEGPGSPHVLKIEYVFEPPCGVACQRDPGATCELSAGHDGAHKTYRPVLGEWHSFGPYEGNNQEVAS